MRVVRGMSLHRTGPAGTAEPGLVGVVAMNNACAAKPIPSMVRLVDANQRRVVGKLTMQGGEIDHVVVTDQREGELILTP
jgi:hypothetical protein